MVSMNLQKTAAELQQGSSEGRPTWITKLMDGGPVKHSSFRSPRAEEQLFGPEAPQIVAPVWTSFPEAGDDESMPVAGKRAALTGKEEAVLFLQYNYARYRLGKLLGESRKGAGSAEASRGQQGLRKDVDLWYGRMMECKENIARANMALVVAMAKRTRIPNVEFSELVSEGNMALLRSIEKFDVSRGFKFSTYACRSILKSFNRLATKTGRYRRLFPTEFDPELEKSDQEVLRDEMAHRDSLEELREALVGARAGLSRVERQVLVERYAIGGGAERVRTLAEVGKVVGLTNERVRQIQNSALAKLRAVMAGAASEG
jgi:RNA polymerase primary sigma factor